MKTIPDRTIWKDHEAMSFAAAHFFVAACRQAISKQGKFTIALSGGSTPKRLYQILASAEFNRNIPWKNVFLFWSDERFVPHTDVTSNYRMIKENLLDHISIPDKNIFPIPVNSTSKASATRYETSIRRFFNNKKMAFDCVLLGLGDDGHTASLFPDTAILKEKKRMVLEVWVEQKQTWRISFTLPLINKATQVVFLVSGSDKAGVVADILNYKKLKPALPAQLVIPGKTRLNSIMGQGNVSWILDEEAAAKI